MRLYEVDNRLIPGSMIPVPQNQAKIESFIKKNCSDALTACGKAGGVMYRGLSTKEADQFLGKSREDRQPSASDPQTQLRVDLALRESGFSALRVNSLFVTSLYSDAEIYAKTKNDIFMIFPVNGFTFTWSPKVNDFYTSKASDEAGDLNTNDNDVSKKKRAEWVARWGYSKDNLVNAIETPNEIMIHGKYIALRFSLYKDLVKRVMNED